MPPAKKKSTAKSKQSPASKEKKQSPASKAASNAPSERSNSEKEEATGKKSKGRKTVPKTPVREKIEALKTGGHYQKRTSSSEFSAKEWKYKMDVMTSEDKANADLPAIIVIGSNGVVTTRNFFYWRKYGGTEQLTIYNNTDTVNAVKVKCSDNNLYRITPPSASLDKQETLTIKVHRTYAPIKPDRILVLIVPTEQTTKEGLNLEKLFRDPSLVYDQVSFTQIVEAGKNIEAYYEPCAPAGTPCLKFDTMALSFKARKKGTESLCITSTMPARIGFKVQCTDSKHFIFRPVFGVIEAKKSFRISVVRNPHPKKRDKMIVCAAVLFKNEKASQLPNLFAKKKLTVTEDLAYGAPDMESIDRYTAQNQDRLLAVWTINSDLIPMRP